MSAPRATSKSRAAAAEGPARVPRHLKSLIWVAAVPIAAIFLAVAHYGRYVRPILDDYRLAVYTRDGGVAGIAGQFYERLTGRVGNGILAGLIYSQPFGVQEWIPPAVLASLGIAIALLIRGALPLVGCRPRPFATLVGGFGAATIILVGQPHLYQTLFWTPGIITHTIPPIVLITLCALAFFARRRVSRIALCCSAFLSGGFLATVSEPVTLVWFTLAGLVLVTHLLFARRRTFPLAFTVSLSLGFCAGLGVLWTSPGNTVRRYGGENFPGSERSPLNPKLLTDTLHMSAVALRELADRPSLFAAAALGLLIGLTAERQSGFQVSSLARHRWLVLCPVLAALLADFAVQFAVRYGYGSNTVGWGGNRTWLNFTPVVVLGLIGYGVLAAPAARRAAGDPRAVAVMRSVVGVTATALLVVALLGFAQDLETIGGEIVTRAAAWEAQRREIELARDMGMREVVYRPLPIDGLQDAFMLPRRIDWVTDAVRHYYQFAGIVKTRRLRRY